MLGFRVYRQTATLLAACRGDWVRRTRRYITTNQIKLAKSSWGELRKIGLKSVGSSLFKNFLVNSPTTLEFFPFKDEKNVYESKSFKAHATLVLTTMGATVTGLNNMDKLIPFLKKLGKTHSKILKGMSHEDVVKSYDEVGKELISAIKEALGEKCTPEIEESWRQVYSILKFHMLSGHDPEDEWFDIYEPYKEDS